ncbi:MAG: hypothetical protein BWY57_01340 [Betaproteobacteria bacterium ADurb.Bin341]|nr:MAG: hypothetical protein BWY57_01340 [Betaproteobacteria bacterium ADurb.Bin341]
MNQITSSLSPILALLTACAVSLALTSCSQAPSKPASAKPLPPEEFSAVVVEAKRRTRGEDPVGRDWQSLDREKLVRLMGMPEFVDLPNKVKETLVDQAGAWELMRFDKPSDAMAMWERWYPGRIDRPVGPLDRSAHRPDAFYADARWAPESAAMMALFKCLPAPAWNVRHLEPMIWVMEQHASWDVPNTFDFGQCVRQQNDDSYVPWPRSPAAPRGKASAQILEAKFSRYLLQQGCTGQGPDRCLPLLYALQSLNPKHDHLPAILQRIEPDFALLEESPIPEVLRTKRGRLNEAEYDVVHAVRRAAMRKAIFLTLKLPVLLERSSEWPPLELEKTLGILLKVSMTLHETAALQAVLGDGLDLGRWPFADPWGEVKSAAEKEAVRRRLEDFGRELARKWNCDQTHGRNELPAPFWLGFGFEKLARNEPLCGAFAEARIGKWYDKARQERNPDLLQPIAELKKYLKQPGALRDELVDALGTACPDRQQASNDYWKVCQLKAERLKRQKP